MRRLVVLARVKQLRVTRASSSVVRAEVARSHESTRNLFDTLVDIERAMLQRIQNDAIIDAEMTRRLSMEHDLPRR